MNTRLFSALVALAAGAALASCARAGDKLVSQAMKAYSMKDYDKALVLFVEALKSDSRYSEELLYTFISNVYSKQEEWEASAAYLEKALSMRADYRGYITLGMVRREAGQDDKAEAAFRAALALDESKVDAYAHLGALYTDAGNAAAAVPLLETAAALAPKEGFVYATLAVAYAAQGAAEKSHAALATAAALGYNSDKERERAAALLESAESAANAEAAH